MSLDSVTLVKIKKKKLVTKALLTSAGYSSTHVSLVTVNASFAELTPPTQQKCDCM